MMCLFIFVMNCLGEYLMVLLMFFDFLWFDFRVWYYLFWYNWNILVIYFFVKEIFVWWNFLLSNMIWLVDFLYYLFRLEDVWFLSLRFVLRKWGMINFFFYVGIVKYWWVYYMIEWWWYFGWFDFEIMWGLLMVVICWKWLLLVLGILSFILKLFWWVRFWFRYVVK